jgi:hypothetical protein
LEPWQSPHCSASSTSWLLYFQEPASWPRCTNLFTVIRPFKWFWWLKRPLLHYRQLPKTSPMVRDGSMGGSGVMRRRRAMVLIVERAQNEPDELKILTKQSTLHWPPILHQY